MKILVEISNFDFLQMILESIRNFGWQIYSSDSRRLDGSEGMDLYITDDCRAQECSSAVIVLEFDERQENHSNDGDMPFTWDVTRGHECSFPRITLKYHSLKLALRKLEQIFSILKYGIELEKDKSLLYEYVTRFSHDGIICVDRDGIVKVFNQKASEILDVAIQDAVGRPLVSFNPTAGLPRVLRQRAIEMEDIISINGRRVAANRAPIIVNDEIMGAISTFQDVTQLQQYEQTIRRRLQTSGFDAKATLSDIATHSQVARQIIEQANQFGRVDATVLISGESGTGKEMFAQGIHNASLRARGPFVAINCAALPEPLLESELFGYDEGAFTGANRGGKQGYFELAHGGTLFLDEISELPMQFQGRLLRVLQERKVLRVGGKAMIPVDVRVIAATNKPLWSLVQDGKFREDLFYRIYVLSLHLPPLRERQGDIEPLAYTFLNEFCKKYGRKDITMSEALKLRLTSYHWPGNIRELRNIMERAVVTTLDHTMVSDDLEISPYASAPKPDIPPVQVDTSIHQVLNKVPALTSLDVHLIEIMKHTRDISKCADQLGVHRTTVWRHLKRLTRAGLIDTDYRFS